MLSSESPGRVIERRDTGIDAEHAFVAVLCGPDGHVLRAIGPGARTAWRSAAKPFQLEVALSALPPSLTSGLDDRDLALGAASHSGQPAHVERVRELGRRLGASEGELRCGAHPPVHEASAGALWREGKLAEPIHNNCSGKHTFMVAATAALGDPGGDYRRPDSPYQARLRARVAEVTGLPVRDVLTAVDGCGVPCFSLSLTAMATAYARLSEAMARTGEPGHAGTWLGRIGWAMQREPWWMSGDGRLDLDLVRGATEPIVSKVGAAGLHCIAIPGRGLGLAVKVLSGSDVARPVALELALARWLPGLVPGNVFQEARTIRNVVGDIVGGREAVPG